MVSVSVSAQKSVTKEAMTSATKSVTNTGTKESPSSTPNPAPSTDPTPSKASEAGGAQKFDKGIEFLLSCLGMSVGLGNIWRFPARAYENGGSAFLIPYLVCALLFGLPGVYLEFALGQYHGKSPPFVFRRIMPVLEGLGWVPALLSAIVGIYFMLIISWISVYIFNVVVGNSDKWSSCDNEWNDVATCFNIPAQTLCQRRRPVGWNVSIPKPAKMIYMQGKCHNADDYKNVSLTGATEQFFNNVIIKPSSGMTDFNSINWPVLISMAVCWILTAVLILKGMRLIGKISYVTVILPYVIILILFVRGVTLDGASDGLHFFLFRADFSALYNYNTWANALSQMCFSLSIGFGGLMNIAAYNKKSHNCFRDAIFLIVGDTAMSVIGGSAVFATLGFLAKQRGISVPEVVKSGPALAFVAYPDAMNQMPVPWLWSFLFFFMLFLLGMSTEMVIVEVLCSCVNDRFAWLRKRRWLVVPVVSLLMFLIGAVMTTDAGIYWFSLFDEYGSGFGAMISITATCIVVSFVYGMRNMKMDIVAMLGEGQTCCSRYFGHTSPFFGFNWQIFSPICGLVIMGLLCWRSYPHEGDAQKYPPLFDVLGWIMAIVPFFMIPFCAFLSYRSFKRDGVPVKGLLMLQKQHPSYARIHETWSPEKQQIAVHLPKREPGEEEPDDVESSQSSQSQPSTQGAV